MPLDFRFYMMEKDIKAESLTAKRKGEVIEFESKMEQAATMLLGIQKHFKQKVLAVTDSWFGNDGLWSRIGRGENEINLLSRLRTNIVLYDFALTRLKGEKAPRGRKRKYGDRLGNVNDLAIKYWDKAKTYSVFLYGKQRDVQAFSQDVMLRKMKCPGRVVWVFRKTRYIALFTTDLSLSVEQIIEYYGARWKIESGFKEIKQEIGSSKTQTRNAFAVTNHLNFCMMATTLT